MSEVRTLKSLLPIVALMLACSAAAGVAWRDFQRLAGSRPAATAAALPVAGEESAATQVAAPPAMHRVLADWALFGTPPSAAPEVAPPPAPLVADEALPDSAAAFQLFGLIEADADVSARAILGTSDADQQEYRVGDPAPDGSKIHAIRARAIILERNGQLEQMKLPDAGAGGPMPDAAPKRFIPRRVLNTGAFTPRDSPLMAMPDAIPVPPPDAAPPPIVEAPMENGPALQ